MKMRTLLLTATAAILLTTAGTGMAMADPYHRGHAVTMHERGRTVVIDHDRYWHPGYHGFVARDRVFVTLRAHGYHRFVGNPYWYQGRYVVRSYDRFGRVVFVEVNPYTGAFLGVARF